MHVKNRDKETNAQGEITTISLNPRLTFQEGERSRRHVRQRVSQPVVREARLS